MTTRFAAKKNADGNVTEEESELAVAVLEQEARLEGLRIAGEELEERLKRDLIASLKDSEARQDVSAGKLAAHRESGQTSHATTGGRRGFVQPDETHRQ